MYSNKTTKTTIWVIQIIALVILFLIYQYIKKNQEKNVIDAETKNNNIYFKNGLTS